jgi:hypothetical protein
LFECLSLETDPVTHLRLEALSRALILLASTAGFGFTGCRYYPDPACLGQWGGCPGGLEPKRYDVVVMPSVDSIRVGQEVELRVKKLPPKNDPNYGTGVYWTSSDTSVATVDSGLVHGTAHVRAKSVGVAMILASVAGWVGHASIVVVPND